MIVQATKGVDLATGRVVLGNDRVLLAVIPVDLAMRMIVQATKGVDLATLGGSCSPVHSTSVFLQEYLL